VPVIDVAAETICLHDYVELRDGRRGTVVDAYPERDTFTVEISDEDGRTLELLPAHRKDLRVLARAS
jgi:hypothetical protein